MVGSGDKTEMHQARGRAPANALWRCGRFPLTCARTEELAEVRLAVRLQVFGLLPEESRRAFVEMLSAYAISGEDVHALDGEEARGVFADAEFEALVTRVRDELLPRLGRVRERAQDAYNADEPADEHMEHMLDGFKTLKNRFGNDPEAVQIIEREIGRAKDWISENDHEPTERAPRSLGPAGAVDRAQDPGASLTTSMPRGRAPAVSNRC